MKLNNINIDIMTISDLESIKDNLESDFDNFWNFNIFKSELENPNSTYFVLKYNNEIIGFAGILCVLNEAELTNIVIKKDHRNNGYASFLLTYIIDYAKTLKICKIHLEVNSLNLFAINLYKKLGFEEVGLRPNYYKNASALLMTKYID